MPKVGGKRVIRFLFLIFRKKPELMPKKKSKKRRICQEEYPKVKINRNIKLIAFIIKRGKVPNTMKTLVSDFREIMYPYTSMNLRENDKTTMKDYMKAAGYYQMSHMVIFTATKKSMIIIK